MNLVYIPGESYGTATGKGLSLTRPASAIPDYALSASAETPPNLVTPWDIYVGAPPSSIKGADIHQGQQVTQAGKNIHTNETGRGRKTWTQESALLLHAAACQLVSNDGGSDGITDAVSSLVRQHHGKGTSRPEHSVPTPLPTVSSASAEIQQGGHKTVSSASAETQQGGDKGYPYSLTLAQRIDAFIPTHIEMTPPLPRKGCNGWTLADTEHGTNFSLVDFPTGAPKSPLDGGQNPPTAAPTSGSLSASAGANTTQVAPSTRQSGTPSSENGTNYGSSYFLNADSSQDAEYENVRHYERVALEANMQLRESGLRLQNGVAANSVRAERLQELENLFHSQSNELEILRRDKAHAAEAAKAAEARYATLAASQKEILWNGDGACFPEQGSDGENAPCKYGAAPSPLPPTRTLLSMTITTIMMILPPHTNSCCIERPNTRIVKIPSHGPLGPWPPLALRPPPRLG